MTPPIKVERLPELTVRVLAKTEAPAAWKVLLAFKAPATWRPAPILDEALEIKPPVKVVSPVLERVLERVAAPVMARVPEAEVLPEESTKKRPWLKVVLLAATESDW